MTEVKGVDQLKEHLERAKEHLSSTNETIKKYTGREPGAPGFKPVFRSVDSESAGRRIFSAALKRGGIGNFEDGPALKVTRRTDDIASKVVGVAYSRVETRRRDRDIHDRLGPLRSAGEGERDRWGGRERGTARDRDWDARDREWGPRSRLARRAGQEEVASGGGGGNGNGNSNDRRVIRRRPITLSSSITRPTDDFDDYTEPEPESASAPSQPRRTGLTASVVRVPEQRSREDAIKEMKSSLAKDDKERNKRIFSGLLLGTLRNFNSQASREEAVAQQRRRNLEARIEERQQEEKADLKRERADLFRARRENQRMVRRIEQKIRSVDAFEAWKREFVKQKKFIRTRTKPKIYYLPRVMDSLSEKRLHRTSKEIDEEVTERRAKMEQEVAQLIEEEPQDPAQLLEETNRVRLTSRLASKDGDVDDEDGAGAAKAEAGDKVEAKREEEEDAARVDVSVFVGDEDEAAALEAVKAKALEEVPLPAPVTVEVLADADIPLPSSPPPRPSSSTVPAEAAAAATTGGSGGGAAGGRKAKESAQEAGKSC